MSTILLKRSLNTNIPASLANGEPAYTANGDVFYIGSNGSIVAIGGKRTPGTLTANQALVVDANKLIDVLNHGNTTVNATVNSIALTLANSTVTISIVKPTAADYAAATKFLAANGSWLTPAGGAANPGGSNTQIEFNDSGAFAGNPGFTFDKTTNIVFSGNSFQTGNSTVNCVVNSVTIAFNGIPLASQYSVWSFGAL